MGNKVGSQKEKDKQLFNIRQCTKYFLCGTNIGDEHLERFDDMDQIGLKNYIKLS